MGLGTGQGLSRLLLLDIIGLRNIEFLQVAKLFAKSTGARVKTAKKVNSNKVSVNVAKNRDSLLQNLAGKLI